jgi:DNA-binding GntR family transcriptional regulator
MTAAARPVARSAGPGAARSKADHAYELIRERIVHHRAAPGERLVIEQLARELDVSVVPVREAIRRLEAEGYVTYTRNVGATVSTIDLERYPETVEAVAVLEAAAVGLAAPHIGAQELAAARELNERMRRSLERLDPRRFTLTNQAFHRVLYERCPNRRLLDLVTREWALLETTRQSVFRYIPERARDSVAEHDRLLRLIEERRPSDEIEAFARTHRMQTARSLLRQLGDEMNGETAGGLAGPKGAR